MRKLSILGLMALVSVITGCATKANIDTNETFWQHKPNTVVIVTTHADKPLYADENAGGSEATFDIANMKAQRVGAHVSQMDVDWYYQGLAERFQQAFAKEHIKAVIAREHPYIDPEDLSSKNALLNRAQLAAEYNADQVLVLAMPFYGARIPQQSNLVGETPFVEGACVLYAELSDPQQTTVYWRHTSNVTKPVLVNAKSETVNANRPPYFPNLTKTIVGSHKMAEQDLLDSFRSGRSDK
jgi:hypothetical protein